MIALSPRVPLPVAWQVTPNTRDRRHQAGNLQICNNGLKRFNKILETADPLQRQLTADQIATTAREVCDETYGLPVPVGVYQRLRCIAAVSTMFKDMDWEIEEAAAWRSATLLEYFSAREVLFPNNAPMVGYLDDAILVEAAWPELRAEVSSFYDYRRLRRIVVEGRSKGATRFRFTRADWLDSREIEHRLQAQVRRTGLGSFVENSVVPMFRVH